MIIGYLSLLARIVMLGSERVLLKKLDHYDSTTIASLFFLIASIFLTPVFFVVPSEAYFIPITLLILTLISSLVYAFGFFAYVKALNLGDSSLVAPLYNSNLLWLMILGYAFLGESVTSIRVSGAIIMFIGVFFLYGGSIKEKIIAIKESKASLYMIAGSVFIAVGRTIDTFIIRDVDPRYYAFLSNLFIGLFILIPVLIEKRGHVIKKVFQNDPKLLLSSSFVNGWSYLFLLVAIGYLEVTVAEPASLLSVFITAILAKRFLAENVEERIPGMLLMVLGAILLFL